MKMLDKNAVEVSKRAPGCLAGSTYYDDAVTVADIRFAAQHEIDLFEEGEQESLGAVSIKALRKFVAWVDSRGAK